MVQETGLHFLDSPPHRRVIVMIMRANGPALTKAYKGHLWNLRLWLLQWRRCFFPKPCHRWYACPSDAGSYVCGDLGHCSQCPDNQYCQGGNPRTTVQGPSQAILSPAPVAIKPHRIEEGLVTRVADGDTITVITANQTKLRIRMMGIDAPETPKGAKFPGQPYGKKAEAYLKQLIEHKRVKVENLCHRPLQAAPLHHLPGRQGHQPGHDRSRTRRSLSRS